MRSGSAAGCAEQLERVPLEGQVAGQRRGLDQPGRQVRPEPRPGLQLALVLLGHRGGNLGGGQEASRGEGVGDHFGAEVEVRVRVADDHGGQGLARVEHGGGQPVPVRASEAGVDQQRLALAGDQGGGLVLDCRRGSPRR